MEQVQQQEAVLKKVYKVGNQEYVLLKVQGSEERSPPSMLVPKLKDEKDYIKAIYGGVRDDKKDDASNLSIGQASLPSFHRFTEDQMQLQSEGQNMMAIKQNSQQMHQQHH